MNWDRRSRHRPGLTSTVLGCVLLAIIVVVLYLFIGNKTAGQYNGWQTYCDQSSQVCFKYPNNWSLEPINTKSQPPIVIKSSDGAVELDYQNPTNSDVVAMSKDAYTAYLYNLQTNPRTTIAGIVVSNKPYYLIINTSSINQFNLKLGKTTADSNITDYYFDSSESLTAYPKNDYTSFSDAKAWFNSADAKSALLVLKSIYFR